ncbi:MAG: nitroreductase family protein [Firmicutes bacterium]|nr:nitroreductase family protein [Bacillota bacterium]
MNFADVLKTRRSIRKFKPLAVPSEDLREIVRLATLAPSAGNRQMWRFITVTNPELIRRMRDAVERRIEVMAGWDAAKGREQRVLASKSHNLFFGSAPAVIVVAGEPYRSLTDELLEDHGLSRAEIDRLRARPDLQSLGGAIQTLMLAAWSKGYGTTWMTGPLVAARELEELLGVKEPWSVVALVPVGLPAEQPGPRPRKPLDEVFELLS